MRKHGGANGRQVVLPAADVKDEGDVNGRAISGPQRAVELGAKVDSHEQIVGRGQMRAPNAGH